MIFPDLYFDPDHTFQSVSDPYPDLDPVLDPT
jgi:hypothetical protein